MTKHHTASQMFCLSSVSSGSYQSSWWPSPTGKQFLDQVHNKNYVAVSYCCLNKLNKQLHVSFPVTDTRLLIRTSAWSCAEKNKVKLTNIIIWLKSTEPSPLQTIIKCHISTLARFFLLICCHGDEQLDAQLTWRLGFLQYTTLKHLQGTCSTD